MTSPGEKTNSIINIFGLAYNFKRLVIKYDIILKCRCYPIWVQETSIYHIPKLCPVHQQIQRSDFKNSKTTAVSSLCLWLNILVLEISIAFMACLFHVYNEVTSNRLSLFLIKHLYHILHQYHEGMLYFPDKAWWTPSIWMYNFAMIILIHKSLFYTLK